MTSVAGTVLFAAALAFRAVRRGSNSVPVHTSAVPAWLCAADQHCGVFASTAPSATNVALALVLGTTERVETPNTEVVALLLGTETESVEFANVVLLFTAKSKETAPSGHAVRLFLNAPDTPHTVSCDPTKTLCWAHAEGASERHAKAAQVGSQGTPRDEARRMCAVISAAAGAFVSPSAANCDDAGIHASASAGAQRIFSTMFGAPAPGGGAFNFGGAPAAASPAFGSAFGASTAPATQPQQQGAFSFGGAAAQQPQTPAFGGGGLFGGGASGAPSTPSAPLFGAAAAPSQPGAFMSFGGTAQQTQPQQQQQQPGAIGAPANPFGSTSFNMFGGGGAAATPAPSGLNFFNTGTLAGAQPQQAQHQAGALGLLTKTGAPVSHATKWDDLTPDAQNKLLALECVPCIDGVFFFVSLTCLSVRSPKTCLALERTETSCAATGQLRCSWTRRSG